MSDSNDNSIPVLHEILVPGRRDDTRPASNNADVSADPREPRFTSEPAFEPPAGRHGQEPVFAPEPSHAAAPVLPPQPLHGGAREQQAPSAYDDPLIPQLNDRLDEPYRQPAHVPHQPVNEPMATDPGVFDRAEPVTPLEAGATVPPDIDHENLADRQARLDADVIAERLRGRFAGFLTGEGRDIVEARCRDALYEHTSALVSQITREVALTLETEMTRWVREAVEEEIARRG